MTNAATKDRRSNGSLTLSLKELGAFSLGLTQLAELMPERTTASQLSFFLYAAMGDIRGAPMTFNEIRELLGPSIGRSLHTTYKVFVDGNRGTENNRSKGLNWLYRVEDPIDNRRKYLHLTDAGRNAVKSLFETLKAGKAMS